MLAGMHLIEKTQLANKEILTHFWYIVIADKSV